MRHLVSLALFTLAAATVSAAPAPEPELTGALKRIRDAGAINVGFAESSMPFSYYDSIKNPIGYAIDICKTVVDSIKTEIKKPDLKVNMQPIKPEDAGSYITSGVIDLHCGPIENNYGQKARVDFGPTYYVLRYRFASHESAAMNEIEDMRNRQVVTVSGTPAVNALYAMTNARGYNVNVVQASSSDEAFRMFQNDKIEAVVLDDVGLAYGVSKNRFIDPALVMLSDGSFGATPLGLVFIKGDKPFKKVVDDSMQQLMKGGKIQGIYSKWFQSPIPPSQVNMELPMSDALRKAFRSPTDSSDAAVYTAQ